MRRIAVRKLYFIASIPATSKDGAITGVVANGTGRKATAEEVAALVELLRTKNATQSLLDSLRDDTYPNPVSAFERRSEARTEASILNSFKGGGGLFDWHVIEVGDSARKPVRKPLGWRILYDFGEGKESSVMNNDEKATVLIDPECPNLSNNRLFPTREVVREVFKENDLSSDEYSFEPVYADA